MVKWFFDRIILVLKGSGTIFNVIKTMLKIRETRKKMKHISKLKYLILNNSFVSKAVAVKYPIACYGV